MTIPELKEKLLIAISLAEEELESNRREVPNSYGHGYSAGQWEAYKSVIDTIDGNQERVLPL